MKKQLLIALATAGSLAMNAQNEKKSHVERCSIHEHEAYLESINPNRKAERENFEKEVNKWIQKQKTSTEKTNAVITIPVVVHVVYKTTAENISDAQVLSQIQVLNQDFTHTNPDASNTPSIFQSAAGNAQINWCMAQVDPQGNPTNGIVRKLTTANSFSTDDKVKSATTGGDNAWPTDKYFNIWVCNLGSSLLGYGEFPTGSLSNTFGFVANYTCYGTTGTAQAPFNGGRTATHEIGHCLNLRHIWGDEPSCSADDNVSDTPQQKGENYGAPSFPQGTSASGGCCNAADQSSMYMNYMDYTDDNAMNMFTNGQVTRMLAVLNAGPYSTLKNNANLCNNTPAGPNDAGVSALSSPSGSSCSTSITPSLTIKNYGTATLTTLTINYNVDGGTNQTYNWTGSLASGATTVVTLPAMTVVGGGHTFNASTSNPNGNTDSNTGNDQNSSTFTIISGGQALPYSFGFEVTALSSDYQVYNGDGGLTWEITSNAAKTGTKSLYINNYDYNANGEIDEITLPTFDLTNITNPSLTFQVAYQLYTAVNQLTTVDTLDIFVSTDCGQTWSNVYNKAGAALVTATPQNSSSAFTPTANQWRLENVPLSGVAGQSGVLVKFRNTTNYENNLYIDDINITGSVGIKTQDAALAFNAYPSPVNHQLQLSFPNQTNHQSSIRVINLLGEVVANKVLEGGIQSSNIHVSHLSNGVYYIEYNNGKHSAIQKIVIQH